MATHFDEPCLRERVHEVGTLEFDLKENLYHMEDIMRGNND